VNSAKIELEAIEKNHLFILAYQQARTEESAIIQYIIALSRYRWIGYHKIAHIYPGRIAS
jgi:hypothetical protein